MDWEGLGGTGNALGALGVLLFQIPPERQALLVQRYYAFDEALARELLGKKLSKGTKKELDEPLRDGQEAPAVPELRGLRCLRPEHDGPLEPGGPGARGGRARRGPAQVLPAGPEGAEGAGDRQGPAGPAQEPGVLGPAGEDLGLQRARGQLQGDRAVPLGQVEPGGPAALPAALHGSPPEPAGLQAPGALGALHGRHQRLPAAHVPRLSRTPKTAWTQNCTPKPHPNNGGGPNGTPTTAWTQNCTPKWIQTREQHPKTGMDPEQHPNNGHGPQTAPQNWHGARTPPQKRGQPQSWGQTQEQAQPQNCAPKTESDQEQHPKTSPRTPKTAPQNWAPQNRAASREGTPKKGAGSPQTRREHRDPRIWGVWSLGTPSSRTPQMQRSPKNTGFWNGGTPKKG
ncbi:acidic fibroblast growth factor intracellular-binding protein isoform X2 [Passer montanus]|uniref:acidic fibroblast growth factor intracellular-binding protein isoform X2 n=1 Tax=Passer montanus TaxID=9160 RepID=UPI001961249A|nr:acidic fibroblast growth factor intracellular-binding protein isoform X2 [Passer montanus]